MTTKELKNKIIKRNEEDEINIFDLIINFEKKKRIRKMAKDDDDVTGFLLLYFLYFFIIITLWR